MLTDNVQLILSFIQTLLLLVITLGGAYFLYKKFKKFIKGPIVVVEKLPKGLSKGYGFVRIGEILLNTKGAPYLFETLPEAIEYKKRFKYVTNRPKIVYQQWDKKNKSVFVGEIYGSDQRQEGK